MRRIAVAGLLPALFAAVGGAQDPPTVTEEQFLSSLDALHPAVVEEAAGLLGARAGLVEVSTLANPELDIEREEPGENVELSVLVSWQLPHAARRPEIESRQEALRAAGAGLATRLGAVRLAMREAFADWALAKERERRLAAQAGRVEALAEREASRAERGEASGLEVHRLELAGQALRARVALASTEGARARERARRWAPDLPDGARPVLPELPSPPPLDTAHPLVLAAEAELAAATLEREAAGRFIASPQLSFGWKSDEAELETVDGPVVGFVWSVPFLNRKEAERSAAEARIATAQARLELTRREVDTEREAARISYEELEATLARTLDAAVESERMLDASEAAFRLGEVSLTDLLDTHRSVAEGALAVLDLYEAALAAHRDLERLAAPDDVPELARLIDSLDLEVSP